MITTATTAVVVLFSIVLFRMLAVGIFFVVAFSISNGKRRLSSCYPHHHCGIPASTITTTTSTVTVSTVLRHHQSIVQYQLDRYHYHYRSHHCNKFRSNIIRRESTNSNNNCDDGGVNNNTNKNNNNIDDDTRSSFADSSCSTLEDLSQLLSDCMKRNNDSRNTNENGNNNNNNTDDYDKKHHHQKQLLIRRQRQLLTTRLSHFGRKTWLSNMDTAVDPIDTSTQYQPQQQQQQWIHINHTYVQNSTIRTAGLGLFAHTNCPKGTLLTCYPGDALIDLSQVQAADRTTVVGPDEEGHDDNAAAADDDDAGMDRNRITWGSHIKKNGRIRTILRQEYMLRAVYDHFGIVAIPELTYFVVGGDGDGDGDTTIDVTNNSTTPSSPIEMNTMMLDPLYLGHFANDGIPIPPTCETELAPYVIQSSNTANAVHQPCEGCHMVTIATRDIHAGEEIFVSYGPEYWIEQHYCYNNNKQEALSETAATMSSSLSLSSHRGINKEDDTNQVMFVDNDFVKEDDLFMYELDFDNATDTDDTLDIDDADDDDYYYDEEDDQGMIVNESSIENSKNSNTNSSRGKGFG